MRTLTQAIIILSVLLFCPPLFAQTPALLNKNEPAPQQYSKTLVLSPMFFDIRQADKFERWFNSQVVSANRDDVSDRQQIREQWEEFLGIDVFYPYFKAKEVQKYVQDKTKVEFFRFRGRAEFDEGKNSVKYIFKKKF